MRPPFLRAAPVAPQMAQGATNPGGSGLNPDVRPRARRYGQRLSVLQRVRLAFCFSGKVAVGAVQDMPVLREKLPDPSRLVITSGYEARENAASRGRAHLGALRTEHDGGTADSPYAT
jgi:hypothetical protein